MKRALVLLLGVLALAACKTAPDEIPEDLTQPELIQLAQESADDENWAAALAYYQAVIDRFPEDKEATVVAQYEMSLIHYRDGNLAAAEAGFEQLLGQYDFDSDELPAWPRVLAERLLEDIRAESAAAEAEAAEE